MGEEAEAAGEIAILPAAAASYLESLALKP